MFIKTKLLIICTVLSVSAGTVIACSSDGTSNNGTSSGNPLNPTDSGGGDTSMGSETGTPDGGCPNKPAGCFCGTPTTQVQFLNRCTNATPLPVNLTFTPAATGDIPN